MKAGNRYFYFFLLAVICIAAFWQIAFFQHPVKYDMPDCYYPWRSFIADALRNGYVPVWNPYQLFGSPIHADPSSGAWYPPVWIIGLLFGYSLKILGWELLLHIWLGGIGFFKLSERIGFSPRTAFLLSIGYMLSGLFVGNAQHITYVVSACWIPFILNYFIALSRRFQYTDAIKGGICVFLMLTGGYPAFYIILIYLLGFLGIGQLVSFVRSKNKENLLKWLGLQAVFGGTAAALSAGFLTSVYHVMPLITRTKTFNAHDAQYGPFSVESFLSFIFPYTSVDSGFVKTDMSMSNGYFGVLLFLFFGVSLFCKTPPIIRMFRAFAFFALAASVGNALPVREFLFDHFPLMNLFRFPSVFRLSVIVGFLISAGTAVEKLLSGEKSMLNITRRITLLIIPLLLITAWLFFQYAQENYTHLWFTRAEKPDAYYHAAIQALFTGGFISLFAFLLYRIRNITWLTAGFAFVLCAEMILNTQLNDPYTVFYKEFTGKESAETEKRFTKGFPPPDLSLPMSKSANDLIREPFWKNLEIFKKQPSAAGMNNFMFASTLYLLDHRKEAVGFLTQNPVAYLGGEILPIAEFNALKRRDKLRPDMLFVQEGSFGSYSRQGVLNSLALNPEYWEFETVTSEKTTFTLLQNYGPGWEVNIDGKPTEFFCSNGGFITLFLPEGNHRVRLSYMAFRVKVQFWITVILLGLALSAAFLPGFISALKRNRLQ